MPAPPPSATPLPREFAGLARQAIAEIDAEHQALVAAARALPRKLVENLASCGNLKRNAALAELDRRMPIKPLISTKRTLIYRTARSCKQPLSDTNQHDGIEIAWLAVGLMRGHGGVTDRPASLFITLHAAGRLLQRSLPQMPVRTAIFAAHDALLAAPEALLLPMEQQQAWLLPVANGAFTADVHVVRDLDGDAHLYLRAATFLDADHFRPEQRAQIAAMRYRDNQPTLGDGLCQPPQLRNYIDRATV